MSYENACNNFTNLSYIYYHATNFDMTNKYVTIF
jgi:hypothetical protein